MPSEKDRVKREYESFKKKFRNADLSEFKQGRWFHKLVRWLLQEHAAQADAAYIKKTYPGKNAAAQAKKAVSLAARHNGIAGGVSAGIITTLELSSLSPMALVTVPAIGSTLAADVVYSTRTQLRATYDLSVIHGAPLSIDDPTDCYFIFLTALGINIRDLATGFAITQTPGFTAMNTRKLLQSGLRTGLQKVLEKVGATKLAGKLTERAALRLLVPGISIPLATWLNFYFTRQMLGYADSYMIRRAAVVQPILGAYRCSPELDRGLVVRIFMAVANAGDPRRWDEHQLNALRICQSTLSLSDAEIRTVNKDLDIGVDTALKSAGRIGPKAGDELVRLGTAVAALAKGSEHDLLFAEALAKLSTRAKTKLTEKRALQAVKRLRAKLF